jgi:hypothetical protein
VAKPKYNKYMYFSLQTWKEGNVFIFCHATISKMPSGDADIKLYFRKGISGLIQALYISQETTENYPHGGIAMAREW